MYLQESPKMELFAKNAGINFTRNRNDIIVSMAIVVWLLINPIGEKKCQMERI